MWKTQINSPVGKLKAYANERGLCGLIWPESVDKRFAAAKPVGRDSKQIFVELAKQLDEYFAGERKDFDLAIDLIGTEFQLEAWAALQKIPYATTRTYAQQAESIGRPKAVRAIGAANGKNPISIVIPCHRVIGKDGSLTGFAGGTEVKQKLLELEQKFAIEFACL